jgi:Cupin-like domain
MPFRSSEGLANPQRYPRFAEATPLLVTQCDGEALFVPSCWAHEVYNETDCLSINHNWLNACNLRYVWRFLHNDLRLIEGEIADCRAAEDWPQQCQLLLRLNSGLDLSQFAQLLLVVLRARLAVLADPALPLPLRNTALFSVSQCLEVANPLLREQYLLKLHQRGELDALMSASQIGRQLAEHFRNEHQLLFLVERQLCVPPRSLSPCAPPAGLLCAPGARMPGASAPYHSPTAASAECAVMIDVTKPWPPPSQSDSPSDQLNARRVGRQRRRRRSRRTTRPSRTK